MKSGEEKINVPAPIGSIEIESGNSIDLSNLKVKDKILPEHINERTKQPVTVKDVSGSIKLEKFFVRIMFRISIGNLPIESRVVKDKDKNGNTRYSYDALTQIGPKEIMLGFQMIPKKKDEKK